MFSFVCTSVCVHVCVHICTSGAKESLPEASDSSLTSSSSFHCSLSSFCRIQHSSVPPPLRLLTVTQKNILNGNLLLLRKPFLLPEKSLFFLFLDLINWAGQLEPVTAGWCAACKVHACCGVGHIHQCWFRWFEWVFLYEKDCDDMWLKRN